MIDRTIRTAGDDKDIVRAADLIARAFHHLGPDRYVVPEPEHRPSIIRRFYHLVATQAAQGDGEVLLTDGAVLVSFDRTTTRTAAFDDERLAEITGDYLPRFQKVEQLLAGYVPTEPHWHIAFLAVEPDQHGQGRGSSLLRHLHTRLDGQRIPAYLEATNADNRRLYRRHGYEDMKPSTILLPTGAAFFRMWRQDECAGE